MRPKPCGQCGGDMSPVPMTRGAAHICAECGGFRAGTHSVDVTSDYVNLPVQALPAGSESRVAYDSSENILKYHDGVEWFPVGPSVVVFQETDGAEPTNDFGF